MTRSPRPVRRGLALLVLVGVVGLGACDDDGGSAGDGLRSVTVMLNWSANVHHVGLFAAREEGWFAEAGYDVTVLEPGDSSAEQAVASGQALLGISAAESVLPARAAGIPVVSVATILPVNDSSLMALADSGITRPRDLVGRTYGGYGGALETELVRALVACDGGDPDGVEQIEVGDADYLSGMDQGRFDAVWVFNGWDVERARLAGVEVTTIDFSDWAGCIPNWDTPVYIARESTLAQDHQVVADLLAVLARGYALAHDDPNTAASDFLAQVPEADEALVRASTAYYADRWRAEGQRWGVQDGATWKAFEAFLRGAGALDHEVDSTLAFTNDALPAP